MRATASSPPPLPAPVEGAPAALVSEPLTWAEICALYPDEWVCLVAIEGQNETDFEFTTARVAGHGKTRKEPLVQSRPARAQYGSIGHYYTGPIVAPVHRFDWLPPER